METGDLIVIFWYDIVQDSSWSPISVIREQGSVLCKSVGWFLSQDDDCIRILTSILGTSERNMEAGSIIIPQKVIKSVEKIRDDELEVE